MPKENINSRDTQDFSVSVGWTKDGETVQLGVVSKSGSLRKLTLEEDFDSIWSTLSKDQLDDLILVLNRARVQAYGV